MMVKTTTTEHLIIHIVENHPKVEYGYIPASAKKITKTKSNKDILLISSSAPAEIWHLWLGTGGPNFSTLLSLV